MAISELQDVWGVKGAIHGGKNIYQGYSAGFDMSPKNLLPTQLGGKTNYNSVGGMLASPIGAAALGAGAGAMAMNIFPEMRAHDYAMGAAIGGVAGAAALPAAGLLGRGIVEGGMKLGRAAWDSDLSGLGRAASAVGRGAGNIIKGVGHAIDGTQYGRTVGAGGEIIAGSRATEFANRVMSPVQRWGRAGGNVLGSMIKSEKAPETLLGHKFGLSGIGKAAVGVAAIAGAVSGVKSAYEESNIGTITPGVFTATPMGPQIPPGQPQPMVEQSPMMPGYMRANNQVAQAKTVPSFIDNGGATGNLVFALSNLRHGPLR